MILSEFFEKHNRVALAFSGGVDSAYLMHEAVRCGVDVTAYYVRSQFQPDFEYDDAIRLADEIGCFMKVIDIDILSFDEIRSNPSNRCYHCKSKIFGAITESARADGYTVIIDGTNASDDYDDRPGMKALKELEILSPLRMAGLSKEDIRVESRKAGLWTYDKPSYSCLATRVKGGLELDEEILLKIERAEGILDKLGFRNYRVRTDGVNARLELTASDMLRAVDKRREIVGSFKEIFETVVMGLEER